ncbi:Structural maintenance of chromosomes protein 3 [Rhizophlyctis rosea]|nr:Structural maintenance of chromosomes protein 3 [Rhizophlyctis rosea]
MNKEERQSLLHEGTGQATISAYVEIIFDNSDQRFPTTKDEVVLRRTIGLKKDDYSLDKKSVTKQEVMSLLETAGFSRSNPYYIVPQGRITELTNAKDAARLQILKEVAGTRIYEQRRQESLKIMDDTESKRTKIDEMLETINDRLEELEEEKEELKQYQEQERKRRCLAYALHSGEQKKANDALEKLEEQRLGHVDNTNALQQRFNDRAKNIADIETEIRDFHQRVELLTLERTQMQNEFEEQSRTKTQLEMIINDLENDLDNDDAVRRKLSSDLEELNETIGTKEAELEQFLPEYEEASAKEKEISNRKIEADTERDALYAKRGRNQTFKIKAERDRWLRDEIKKVEQTIAEQEERGRKLEEELRAEQTKVEALANEVKNSKQRLESRKGSLEEIDREFAEVRQKRNELEERKKELWREESKLTTSLETYRSELSKCERNLQASCDRMTSSGLKAVERITAQLRLKGVHGPLYKLFDVNERYTNAVEVVAGGSLFHIVVEDDDTATRILDQLNRERSGRVTFMPLNQLHPSQPNYPVGDDVVPMIRKIHFDKGYAVAIQQVFNKAIICNSLEAAAGYSRSHGLNAVTLDGDRADRKGSLTGGYRDPRQSRLENIRNLRQWDAKYKDAEAKIDDVKKNLVTVEQEITRVRDDLGKLDARRRQIADSREPLMNEINGKTREEAALRGSIASKERSVDDLASHVRQLNIQLTAYQTDLSAPFTKALSNEEDARLEELTAQIEQLDAELNEAISKARELETRKRVLEVELNANLKRRRDEAAVKLQGMASEGEGTVQLAGRRREMETITQAIDNAHARIEDIDRELDELSNSIQEANKNLERARTEQINQHKEMEAEQRAMERYHTKKTGYLKQKEEALKSIRELGLLPEEAFEKYQNLSYDQLSKRLHNVKEALKKYSHVNKKAFEQYQNFTKQRGELDARKEELDNAAEAIEDLIKNLDQRKDEVISGTFKQVAQFFEEVWERLVPAGRGRLIMLRRTDGGNDESQDPDVALSEEEEEDDEDRPQSKRKGKGKAKAKPKAPKKAKTGDKDTPIDQYTGVAIQVSFNSKTDEGLRMSQLSGGQKSLVALALIFAIQKCDPAPFYLFDEIDAALDAQYRTAVANMIHELADDAQFITTTFRPELLVHADQFYGVTFVNKVSRIQCITREDAESFVENQAPAQ